MSKTRGNGLSRTAEKMIFPFVEGSVFVLPRETAKLSPEMQTLGLPPIVYLVYTPSGRLIARFNRWEDAFAEPPSNNFVAQWAH